MMQKPTKPGNISITRVGHTTNQSFGNSPDVRVKGRSELPAPLTFGGGK